MAKTISKPAVKVKPDPTTKNVSSSTNGPMAFYKNLPGPRGKTGTQGA